MNPHSYLCVFTANPQVKDNVEDKSKDPDFSEPATWGICRPQVRVKWTTPGSHILFIGLLREQKKYYVKGWIRIGERISYIEALKKFPKRPNVIIRPKGRGKPPEIKWKRQTIEKFIQKKYGAKIPQFLRSIKVGKQVFMQNPKDDHQVDNWKCQRMFLCSTKQLTKCSKKDKCLKEAKFSSLRGYVIADKCHDVGHVRIPVEKLGYKIKDLRTPRGQHNALLITPKRMKNIKNFLSHYSA